MTKLIAAIFTLGWLGFLLWHCRGLRLNARALSYGAIAAAMTLLLACIYLPLPTGASISLGSWLPLMVLSICYDHRLAMVSGLLCGMLAPFILPGWSLVHWVQYFLEYMTIFSCMGCAGLFGKTRKKIFLGALLAISLRFWAQVISGVIFFGQYSWGFSLLYHLSGKVPEGIITMLILLALPLDRLQKFAKEGSHR